MYPNKNINSKYHIPKLTNNNQPKNKELVWSISEIQA